MRQPITSTRPRQWIPAAMAVTGRIRESARGPPDTVHFTARRRMPLPRIEIPPPPGGPSSSEMNSVFTSNLVQDEKKALSVVPANHEEALCTRKSARTQTALKKGGGNV